MLSIIEYENSVTSLIAYTTPKMPHINVTRLSPPPVQPMTSTKLREIPMHWSKSNVTDVTYVTPTAAWPLVACGLFIMSLCFCFCCYLWRLRRQGHIQMGFRKIHFNKSSSQIDEACPVCLEEFKALQKVALTHCGHKFHCKCIRVWLSDHGTCPLCKTVITCDPRGRDGRSTTPGEDTRLMNIEPL